MYIGLTIYVPDECNELNQCKWPSSSSTYSMKILWWRCTVHWSIMRFLSFYINFVLKNILSKSTRIICKCKLSANFFFHESSCHDLPTFDNPVWIYPAENLKIQIGQKESITLSSLRFENLTTALHTINLQRTFCQKSHILNKLKVSVNRLD